MANADGGCCHLTSPSQYVGSSSSCNAQKYEQGGHQFWWTIAAPTYHVACRYLPSRFVQEKYMERKSEKNVGGISITRLLARKHTYEICMNSLLSKRMNGKKGEKR